MFQNKMDILLFLLYISILIFVEKITDHHHTYNRRSEITHMNLITCNGTAKVWHSASKNLSYISIFTCRILKTLHSIVLAIMQKKLSNKYLVYEAEWNYVKMNHDGKCKSLLYYFFFTSVANTFIIILKVQNFLISEKFYFKE